MDKSWELMVFQIYMNIACTAPEIDPRKHTHAEIDPTKTLSVIASMTPFSDFNQSPRNMYQCQVRGKCAWRNE